MPRLRYMLLDGVTHGAVGTIKKSNSFWEVLRAAIAFGGLYQTNDWYVIDVLRGTRKSAKECRKLMEPGG